MGLVRFTQRGPEVLCPGVAIIARPLTGDGTKFGTSTTILQEDPEKYQNYKIDLWILLDEGASMEKKMMNLRLP